MEGLGLRGVTVAGLLVLISACADAGSRSQGTADGGRQPVATDFASKRHDMVEQQIRARGVNDPVVLEAMLAVPRHEFVPARLEKSAYDDNPLPIGEGQTISQPYIVALMTAALRPLATDRVLELGTGSGYQAAVLAAIVDTVYTIEYFPSLAESAAEDLARLGYDNVVVKAGDGWRGWPEHAPFDAAIITFAAPEVPEAVVDQLAVGGRLCMPMGEAFAVQELMLYTKQADGTLLSRSLGAVRFVPVQGEGRESEWD